MSSLIPNISIGHTVPGRSNAGENSPSKQEKETVLSAVEAAVENGHPEIVVLEQGFQPWKKEIFEAENYIFETKMIKINVKYIVFHGWGGWRVQAIPMDPTFNKNNQQTPYQMSLQVRRPFPPSWWGLCDETLFAMCKVDGATFVQKSGFICGHKTMAGAFAMAAASLKSNEISTNSFNCRDTKTQNFHIAGCDKEISKSNKRGRYNAARCVAQYNQVIGNEFLGIGNIEDAISHFEKAYSFYLSNYEKNYTTFEKQDFDHLDTCAVFYGESLEHSCVHIFKAISIIKDKILFNNAVCSFYDEKRNVFQTFPVSTLLLLKLLYVSPVYHVNGSDASCPPNSTGQVDDDGQISRPPSIDLILELLDQIGNFPSDLKADIRRRFKSHWAFYLFH